MARRNLFVILFIFILNTEIVLSAPDDKCVKIPEDEKPQPSKETLIKEHILCDYDKTIRPTLNKDQTKITFVFIAEKTKFSEYTNSGILEGTLILQWTDEHLSWNPIDYDDVKKVHMNTDEIWIPDLSIYNNSPYGSREIITTPSCAVYYNKKVICVFQSSLRGICTPDFRHWPYDIQNCTIKIGSWYHAGSELDYNLVKVRKDMSVYEENTDWLLKDLSMKVDPGIYKTIPNETFPSVKLQFLVARRLSHKFITIMLPFLVIISLTMITLMLDPRSSDRIYLSVLNIPCHIMLLIQIAWDTPECGDVLPYIILYLRDSNVLSSIILIETMIVRYLLGKTNVSPLWLVTVTTTIIDSRPGKLLLYQELNIKDEDENAASDEIGTLVEFKGKPSEWYLLGRIIDKLLLIIAIILYFISFLVCMT